MMQPFIFGLFDDSLQIAAKLKSAEQGGIPTGSIHSNGYTHSFSGMRQLIFRSRIYNLDEIRHLYRLQLQMNLI
jgi:hypothetical protein